MLIYLFSLTHVCSEIMLKSDIGRHLNLESTVNDTKHQIVKKCHLSGVQEEDDPEQCTVNQDPALTDIVNDPYLLVSQSMTTNMKILIWMSPIWW